MIKKKMLFLFKIRIKLKSTWLKPISENFFLENVQVEKRNCNDCKKKKMTMEKYKKNF